MSNTGEMLKRALKGDIDPAHIFGSPTSSELRANKTERQRRAEQIAFERDNEMLKRYGGSIDPATKQIKKLKPWRIGSRGLFLASHGPLMGAIQIAKGVKEGKENQRDVKRSKEAAADSSTGSKPKLTKRGDLSARRFRQPILR